MKVQPARVPARPDFDNMANSDPLSRIICEGVKMPLMGFAAASPEIGVTTQATEAALAAGYRHIQVDSRDRNELEVGNVLRKWFESGRVTREEVFLSIKVNIENPSKLNVRSRVVQMMYSLGCDQIDLGVLDLTDLQPDGLDPKKFNDLLMKAWKSMESLEQEGQIRVAAICHYDVTSTDVVVTHAQRPPLVFQSMDYFDMGAVSRLDKYCKYRKLSPILEVVDMKECGDLDGDAAFESYRACVADISRRMRRSPEQVMVRAALQSDCAVVARFSNPKAIRNSFQVLDFRLDKRDMKKLQQLSS